MRGVDLSLTGYTRARQSMPARSSRTTGVRRSIQRVRLSLFTTYLRPVPVFDSGSSHSTNGSSDRIYADLHMIRVSPLALNGRLQSTLSIGKRVPLSTLKRR